MTVVLTRRELSPEELEAATGRPAPERLRVWRDAFGPITGAAGAVFPNDVHRCRCGHIQRPYNLESQCSACGKKVFADPAPVGHEWRDWTPIPCPTCGAAGDAPCIATGRVIPKGDPMKTQHAARRRMIRRRRP